MTRWLITWCVFVVGLVGSVGNSYAFQCSPGRVFACSNQQVCYRATVNTGHIVKYYSNEVKRRQLVCSARPLFNALSKADRSHVQHILREKGYYNSSIDGLYGRGTAAALRAFNKEYRNNADLTKASNIRALLDNLLKEKRIVEDIKSDPKIKLTLNFEEGGLKVELGSGETAQAKEPMTPPVLDFAQIKASYDAGNYSQAFKDAQTLSVDGNPDAQLYLGKMYADGRGTLQVTTYAHMWFNIASMNGSNEAFEERKLIQKQMTPELINEAQGMAVACIKSDYKDCGFLISENKTMANNNRISPSADDLRYYFLDQSKLKRKQIQYALKRLRYYRSSVDGLYGKGTARALSDYLKDRENIKKLSEIFLNLTTEVDVPDSFKEQSQINAKKPKVVKSEAKPDTSSQGYTKAQAQAICEPQADLAGMNAANAYRPRTRSIDCFGYGSIVSCNQGSSGGAWGGILHGMQKTDAKRQAYRATMDSCMAQLGWY